VLCAVAAAALGWTLRRNLLPAADPGKNGTSFLLGTSILTFCFAAGSNCDYRCVFLVFTLPYLMELAARSGVPRLRRLARATVVLLLVLVWSEAVLFHVVVVLTLLGHVQRGYDLVPFLVGKHSLAWLVIAGHVVVAAAVLQPVVRRAGRALGLPLDAHCSIDAPGGGTP
jgi:hypothetical protein